jgi:hypothetical protein
LYSFPPQEFTMRQSTKNVAGAAALAVMLAGAGFALAQNTSTPTDPAASAPAAQAIPTTTAVPGAATTQTPSTTQPADSSVTVTPGAQSNPPSPAAANPGLPTSPAMRSDATPAPMDTNRATAVDPAPRADRN